MTTGPLLDQVLSILERVGQEQSSLRATALYNEGWMLQLTLDWASTMAPTTHPLHFLPGAHWFSEALLPSQFLPRTRGDQLAETWTHADGSVGHFHVGAKGRADLELDDEATQLTIIEAKMFSRLSKRTTRDDEYDQAARTVACMAEVLSRRGRLPSELDRLEFFVIAPEEQRRHFVDLVTTDSIRAKVTKRVQRYDDEMHERWFREWFKPTLDKVKLDVLSWEDVLEPAGPEYGSFYDRCLKHNRALST